MHYCSASGVQKTPTLTESWASDGESDFDAIEDELLNNEDPLVNFDNDEQHNTESMMRILLLFRFLSILHPSSHLLSKSSLLSNIL